jgi:hypothetical protein
MKDSRTTINQSFDSNKEIKNDQKNNYWRAISTLPGETLGQYCRAHNAGIGLQPTTGGEAFAG